MTRPPDCKLALWLCAAITTLLPAYARGEDRTVSASLSGCEGLDRERVTELIATEIDNTAEIAERSMDLAVSISCEPDGIAIGIVDRLTDDEADKRFPPFATDEREPERTVALAVTQLLVTPQRAPADPAPAPAPAEATAVPDPARGEVSVEGGVRFRALGELLPAAHVGLVGGGEVADGWVLLGLATFEYGRASREMGFVAGYAFRLGLGVAHRWSFDAAIGLEAGASVSGGYTLLRGNPDRSEDIAGEVGGFTGELAVFAGPVLVLGRFAAALDVQGGYALENPVGTVEDEDDVSLGGFWAGAILRLGLLVG